MQPRDYKQFEPIFLLSLIGYFPVHWVVRYHQIVYLDLDEFVPHFRIFGRLTDSNPINSPVKVSPEEFPSKKWQSLEPLEVFLSRGQAHAYNGKLDCVFHGQMKICPRRDRDHGIVCGRKHAARPAGWKTGRMSERSSALSDGLRGRWTQPLALARAPEPQTARRG
jgi:hypothetical protein